MGVHVEKAVAMAPAELADARALSHSLAFQRNVRPPLTMKVGLHSLRHMVHNSALAGKDDPSISQGYGILFRQIQNRVILKQGNFTSMASCYRVIVVIVRRILEVIRKAESHSTPGRGHTLYRKIWES